MSTHSPDETKTASHDPTSSGSGVGEDWDASIASATLDLKSLLESSKALTHQLVSGFCNEDDEKKIEKKLALVQEQQRRTEAYLQHARQQRSEEAAKKPACTSMPQGLVWLYLLILCISCLRFTSCFF